MRFPGFITRKRAPVSGTTLFPRGMRKAISTNLKSFAEISRHSMDKYWDKLETRVPAWRNLSSAGHGHLYMVSADARIAMLQI